MPRPVEVSPIEHKPSLRGRPEPSLFEGDHPGALRALDGFLLRFSKQLPPLLCHGLADILVVLSQLEPAEAGCCLVELLRFVLGQALQGMALVVLTMCTQMSHVKNTCNTNLADACLKP